MKPHETAHVKAWLVARAVEHETLAAAQDDLFQRGYQAGQAAGYAATARWLATMPRWRWNARPVTDAEFRKLLRHGKAAYRRLLLFLRHSSARAAEAACLRWPDIDWQKGIAVPSGAGIGPIAGQRPIVLAPVLMRLLRWLQHQPRRNGKECDYVFLNLCGRPWISGSIYTRLCDIRRAAGLSEECRFTGLSLALNPEKEKQP